MKSIPKIQKYMTTLPHSINAKVSIETAIDLMREHRIRHLPVLTEGKLVGVVTERDVKFASSFERSEPLLVEDVMSQDAYAVAPDASLDSVVLEMAEHKYGCAIIQDNKKTVGIFTATDGLRVLGEILQSRFKPN